MNGDSIMHLSDLAWKAALKDSKEEGMKVAICFNEKDGMFEAYHYSILFKIFGPSCFGYITGWSNEENLIKMLHKKIYGKIKLIRIVEVKL